MPQVTYRGPDGQTVTTDLNNAPPQVQTLYNQNYLQPQASLQQTQASTQETQAAVPGVQAKSSTDQIQAQQAGALKGLSSDLANKMTLSDAIKKYVPLGMSADDVFKQYLGGNTWGPNGTPAMPVENPTELQNKGITATALGKIGDPGSFMDRFNTKNAISELRSLQDTFNKTSTVGNIPIVGNLFNKAYNAQKLAVADHLSSLIPGASQGAGSNKSFLDSLPDPSNPADVAQANDTFGKIEAPLLQSKGYTAQQLGLPVKPQTSNQQTTGKDLLNGLLNTVLPTGGAIAGGIGGGALGGALDIPTGVIPGAAAGAVVGAGAGGAGGQALADLLTGKKPGMDVATTGVLSGAGEGAGAVVGNGLSSILGKMANSEITGGLGLTKFGQNAVEQANGEPLSKTLSDNGLKGINYEGLSSGINKVQASFNAMAKSTAKFDPESFLQNASQKIDQMVSSSVPSVQRIGQAADEAVGNIMQKISDGKITTIKDLNNERLAFDKATTDSQFNSDQWGVNRTVGDILRSSVQGSADKAGLKTASGNSLTDVGENLRKLYNLKDAAQGRAGQQAGGNGVLSLSNLLMSGAASVATGMNPLVSAGIIPLIRSGLAHPAVAPALSSILGGASKAATPIIRNAGGAAGGALGGILGQ